MSDADLAYAAALAVIRNAIADERTALDFNREDTRALATLPPEIGDVPELETIRLDYTQVTDLAPLQGGQAQFAQGFRLPTHAWLRRGLVRCQRYTSQFAGLNLRPQTQKRRHPVDHLRRHRHSRPPRRAPGFA